MSIGGTLFSFICKLTAYDNFRSVCHSFCSVRGPSALDKLKFNFFYSTSNDNTYIYDVHRWYTFFVFYVNEMSHQFSYSLSQFLLCTRAVRPRLI